MADQYTSHDLVMDRILLRFRPIAPKPVGGDAASTAVGWCCAGKFERRNKRKCIRARNRQSYKRRNSGGRRRTFSSSSSPPEKSSLEDGSPPPVTLQLLPERSETDRSNSDSHNTPQNWNLIHHKTRDLGLLTTSSGGFSQFRPTIDTWIFVECVTYTFPDRGFGLGFSDEEKIRNLQANTCPGFVSDGRNNVVWVNEAYRRMVAEDEEARILVWLVVKEELPYCAPSFACRVRMSQQTKHGHKWNKIMACDVWKMEFPGYAWKLDVRTALGLAICLPP